ncbi:MAG: SAM-dependent chlorinase/fluorinase [Desulfobulbus sp.]|nr:SAM-dependent chlorinase/fluorinase [Desulfobulbus sp.]
MGNELAIITLTTDFGLQDPYVGQLKGAVLTGCPTAAIVDLTHAIPAWDVAAAAVAIRTSYCFFPPGTIHVIVVDPGVGSGRAILVAAGYGHFFVAPDNGCLSLLVADRKIESVHRVERPSFFTPTISPTFHGRDIMAPVAAALARTGDPGQFGPAVAPASIRMVNLPQSAHVAGCLQGQVLRIDHFGNLHTTIRVGPAQLEPARFDYAEIGGQRISRLAWAYHEAPPGALLVLVSSAGYLEIAANQASAATLTGCRPGEPVTVHLGRTE